MQLGLPKRAEYRMKLVRRHKGRVSAAVCTTSVLGLMHFTITSPGWQCSGAPGQVLASLVHAQMHAKINDNILCAVCR